ALKIEQVKISLRVHHGLWLNSMARSCHEFHIVVMCARKTARKKSGANHAHQNALFHEPCSCRGFWTYYKITTIATLLQISQSADLSLGWLAADTNHRCG